jgi:hypothetical protein
MGDDESGDDTAGLYSEDADAELPVKVNAGGVMTANILRWWSVGCNSSLDQEYN